MSDYGFRITGGKGFHVTFGNGYTVSVQFGAFNYCRDYPRDFPGFSDKTDEQYGKEGSHDAETAVWGPDGKFIERDGDQVQGRQSPEQVLALLNWAASQSASAPIAERAGEHG